METWNPDQKLIERFVEHLRETRNDLEAKVVFCPDGTEKGGNGRSLQEVFQEMQEGTKFGRSLYGVLQRYFSRVDESNYT